jgi:dephospho-CoA kinase
MKVWGLTGQVGSGKTTAVEFFKKKGIPVLEVDKISPRLLDKNTSEGKEGFEKIYRLFGNSVLDKLGNLDRSAIRKRILQNPHEKQSLEEIINPILHKIVTEQMKNWNSQNVALAFVEGARLFESGIDKLVFKVLTISAPEDQRTKRVSKRDSLGKDEAAMLVKMQESQLMKNLTKNEVKNDKKISDFESALEDFISKAIQP